MSEEYQLYYWPMLPGRGEVIRMIFEDAGIPYRDVARHDGIQAVLEARRGTLGHPRPFAPPILVHGDIVLSQSAVIARYVAEREGLPPTQPRDHAIAQQHMLGWSDLVAEVHDTHHPVSVGLPYEDQIEAAKLRTRHFFADRLGAWLGHFEAVVSDGSGVHVPSEITYPDLMARYVIRGLEYAFPRTLEQHRTRMPKLLDLIERVEARPNLAAYLASERSLPFNQHGIFRHYPELDQG